MSIPKSETKKFAKLVAEEFLKGKETADLQGTTQDHIDANVIPIMTEVEDAINGLIADEIRKSFDTKKLEEEDDWWTGQR